MLDPEQNIELLVREGSFEMNLVRALLILLGHLALVAALGLTASTVFSFPVATFIAVSVMTVSLMGHYMAVTAVRPDREMYIPWNRPNFAPFWTAHPTLEHFALLFRETLLADFQFPPKLL